MKFRHVIQIASQSGSEGYDPSVLALCNDGTIWEIWNYKAGWNQMPDVPGTLPGIELLEEDDPDE